MAYDANIKRLGAMALFDLKGAQSALAEWCGDYLADFPSPNTVASLEDRLLLHIGRNHWLVVAELEKESALEADLKPTEAPGDISVVHVSDTQCFFQITGQDADQIISIASPLDVHRSVFPENGATFTDAFGLKALIMRRPDGFWLAVEQSFGDMLEDYFRRALA